MIYTDTEGNAVNRDALTRMYRYESYVDEDGVPTVHVVNYIIQKHTARGVWITDGWSSKRRFVLLQGWKRFAWPTLAEALKSLCERKRRHLNILRNQLESAEKVKAFVDELLAKGEIPEVSARAVELTPNPFVTRGAIALAAREPWSTL